VTPTVYVEVLLHQLREVALEDAPVVLVDEARSRDAGAR
jgi:hypothetical protein